MYLKTILIISRHDVYYNYWISINKYVIQFPVVSSAELLITNQIAVFPKNSHDLHATTTCVNHGLLKACCHGIDIEERRTTWIFVFVS